MDRIFGLIAAFAGVLATALGAYGAHGLPSKVSPALLAAFNTAVQYQFVHLLALMMVALAWRHRACRWLVAAGSCFIAGMLCFSGSIYLLVLSGSKIWGPITPIGGFLLMVGWGLFAIAASRWESRK
ncbi:MAG: DUF423 domain-containing protein [Ferrimonas sp.]